MTAVLAALSAFLASAVETVEAVTIVLAVGVTRGWRPALGGAAAAIVVLAGVVAALGPALERIPIDDLRLVIGVLLLAFGLQWLKKAVLRAAGRKRQRDENAAFERDAAAARAEQASAIAIAFKGVLLEGLEVAVIVLTLGAAHRNISAAAIGAAAAVVLVTAVGAAVRAPLARVPENALALAVGVMLVSFGVFWTVEGARVHWPGGDAILPAVVAAVALLSFGATSVLRAPRGAVERSG
jgi:uncharacterized membrane protein